MRRRAHELTMDGWDIGRQARTGDHQPDDIGSPLRAGPGAMQVVRPARPGLAASNDEATGPKRVLSEPTARTARRR
jgi:hypothetical protein